MCGDIRRQLSRLGSGTLIVMNYATLAYAMPAVSFTIPIALQIGALRDGSRWLLQQLSKAILSAKASVARLRTCLKKKARREARAEIARTVFDLEAIEPELPDELRWWTRTTISALREHPASNTTVRVLDRCFRTVRRWLSGGHRAWTRWVRWALEVYWPPALTDWFGGLAPD